MDPLKIVAILQQLATLGATIADLVEQNRAALSSEDEAALKKGLADLEARNTESYRRVKDKLATAGRAG